MGCKVNIGDGCKVNMGDGCKVNMGDGLLGKYGWWVAR